MEELILDPPKISPIYRVTAITHRKLAGERNKKKGARELAESSIRIGYILRARNPVKYAANLAGGWVEV